jgi:LmbE family N-acetylglucosaminyl deacetylase
VLPLHLARRANQRLDVLCIGAHCDDIEIGCGGTLLALQQQYPRVRVHWLVLTSDARRHAEAMNSMATFVRPGSRGEVRVHDLPDGRLPAHFAQVKAHFEDLRTEVDPDWVLSHHGGDRHQDHALLSEVAWQTFRDHAIWEYEVPKYDGDLVTPNVYVPLPAELAERKAETIMKAFRSQHGKSWFRSENLLALMRLRGLECRADSGFAEAFHCRKLVFAPAAPGAGKKRPKQKGRR